VFNFTAFVSGNVEEKGFKPRRGVQPNEERVSALLASLLPKLDAYDLILGAA
jgi:glutathione S-transferase